jgi:hypothetical protein
MPEDWSRADLEFLSAELITRCDRRAKEHEAFQKQLCDLIQKVGTRSAGADNLIEANERAKALSTEAKAMSDQLTAGLQHASRIVDLNESREFAHSLAESLRPLAQTEER